MFQATVNFLLALGHDVETARNLGMAKASDIDLLNSAHQLARIFVTRDRDFGNLTFVRRLGAGVVFLRTLPSTLNSVHEELKRVLNQYSENDLLTAFVVVEPGRHRFRRLRP